MRGGLAVAGTVGVLDAPAVGVLLDVPVVLVALTLLPAIWRAARGPAEVDRAPAAPHVSFAFVAPPALLALRFGRLGLLGLVVVGTLIGFISAVTLARLVGRVRR